MKKCVGEDEARGFISHAQMAKKTLEFALVCVDAVLSPNISPIGFFWPVWNWKRGYSDLWKKKFPKKSQKPNSKIEQKKLKGKKRTLKNFFFYEIYNRSFI